MLWHADPEDQQLYTKRGQDTTFTFAFAVAPGSIAGLTFKFGIKRRRGVSVVYLIEKTLTITEAIPDANEVIATLDLTDDEMDLPPGRYFWDVWTTTEGSENVYALGYLSIEPTPRKG